MTYRVRKGQHYSAGYLGSVLRAALHLNASGYKAAEFTLDETFVVDLSGDITKLFGLSDELDHHCCSARFGLGKPQLNGHCGLYTYTYLNGELSHEHVMDLHLHGVYRLELQRLRESWVFSAQNLNFSEWRPMVLYTQAEDRRRLFYFTLFPYYGGDAPAPRDTNFNLKWL